LWVVLPRVLPMLGTALHPIPARTTFDAEVEARVLELGDTHDPDDPIFARLREDTLRQYGVSRVEDLPINYNGLVTTKGEEATTNAYREHLQRLADVYRRQDRVVEWAGLLSPYVGVRLVSMALSGSNGTHQLEFERQAEAYRYRLVQALNDLHTTRVTHAQDRYAELVNGMPSRARIDASSFDALPDFNYAMPGVRWALAGAAGGVAAWAAGLAALFGAFFRAAKAAPRL
jgi:ABC-2 type transport system permease protein